MHIASSATTDNAQILLQFGALGPRAAPISSDYTTPTLIIGVGQVGWQATSLMQGLVTSAFSKDSAARFQFLAIARRPTLIAESRLSRDNLLLLQIEEMDWLAVPGRYAAAGVARWWPKPLRDKSLVSDLTSVRAYGRLLLWDTPSLVTDLLQQRVTTLQQTIARPGSDSRASIIIVGSIAEAEGSAMLLDIAATLRMLLADMPASITAILTAETTLLDDAGRALAMANTYASLKELDSVMTGPGHYQIGLPIARDVPRALPGTTARPFDYVLITGDVAHAPISATAAAAAQRLNQNIAAPLADMMLSWVLATIGHLDPPLPKLEVNERSERFDGYTTFNIAKLGLPTGAASDLVGSRLALQVVAAMNSLKNRDTAKDWATEMLIRCRNELQIDTISADPRPHERMTELLRRVRLEALINDLNRAREKQDFSLKRFADDLIRKLDAEDRAMEMIDEGTTAHRLDSLRARVEDAFTKNLRTLDVSLSALPTQLSCVNGRGLAWTAAALDILSAEMNRALNGLRDEAALADQAWFEARRRALTLCYEHDERYSGVKRLLRGSNSKELSEIATAFEQATTSLLERIRLTSITPVWQTLWESIDQMRSEVRQYQVQLERTAKAIAEGVELTRQAMDNASQKPPTFPAGVVADGDWFRRGANAVFPKADQPPDQTISKVWRAWSATVTPGERRIDRFMRELLLACRLTLIASFEFAPLASFVMERQDQPAVQKALTGVMHAAIPQWPPAKDTSHWQLFEFVRGGMTGRGSILPLPEKYPWMRRILPSPDPDEMVLVRLAHGLPAEGIETLRLAYRRAYERIAAEGVPLHLDRRMDATLPDLMRNSALAEVSAAWERALRASQSREHDLKIPLAELIRMLAMSIGVEPTKVSRVGSTEPDFLLTIFPLPTFRLRLPPAQCPVVFCYSTRRPRELGAAIYQSVSVLGLPEPFIFLVNVNNRPDMDVIVETLRIESYNVVILDEANFKRVVGSRQPLAMLSEIVLSEVDLTLVSPFYTKAPVPERMFYGREREIKDVRRKLKTHSVALIGGRRIGKTSTLQQIDRLLNARDSGQQPYYLDCHNSMSYQHFFSAIRRRWNIKTETPDPTAFEDVVTEIHARHPNEQIVFLFDEVDRLLVTDQQQDHSELLFRTFRSLSNEGKCQFIFSGERWLARAMQDSFSALFNFALPVPLVLLEKQVVARLVTEPFEMMNIWLEDASVLINRIYEVSAGHPNIVQTICQEMVVAVDSDKGNVGLLKKSHLEVALRNHKLQEEIIHTFWGQMNDLARIITLVWPNDVRQLTLEEIFERVRGVGLRSATVQNLQEAMKDLELYCFVAPKGRYYELVPVDFPHLLDEMTIKGLEISAMIEKIEARQKKDIFRQ